VRHYAEQEGKWSSDEETGETSVWKSKEAKRKKVRFLEPTMQLCNNHSEGFVCLSSHCNVAVIVGLYAVIESAYGVEGAEKKEGE
jgi:hypothetical protein